MWALSCLGCVLNKNENFSKVLLIFICQFANNHLGHYTVHIIYIPSSLFHNLYFWLELPGIDWCHVWVDFSQIVICQIRFLSTVNLPILFNIYWNCFSLKKVKQMFWSHFLEILTHWEAPIQILLCQFLSFFISFYPFLSISVPFLFFFIGRGKVKKTKCELVDSIPFRRSPSFIFFASFFVLFGIFSWTKMDKKDEPTLWMLEMTRTCHFRI